VWIAAPGDALEETSASASKTAPKQAATTTGGLARMSPPTTAPTAMMSGGRLTAARPKRVAQRPRTSVTTTRSANRTPNATKWLPVERPAHTSARAVGTAEAASGRNGARARSRPATITRFLRDGTITMPPKGTRARGPLPDCLPSRTPRQRRPMGGA